jgi:hypothetical protein
VHGARITEREVLAHIARGQDHPLAELLDLAGAAEDGGDLEPAVAADGEDAVGLAIDRAAAVACVAGEVPPVATGLHQVADPSDRALQPQRHPVLGDSAEADEFGAQCRGQPGRLFVGVDQQQRPVSGEAVAQPGGPRGGLGLLHGARVEQAAMAVVVLQHGGVAVA